MKPIYIIGFMGAGKTSLGRKMAHQLGFSFIDLDRAIEVKVGRTVTSLFDSQGEAYFRKLEAETLKEISQPNTVIACGGGTPCFNHNLDYMFDEGLIVYLKMEPGMLLSRLQTNRHKRPLVAALSEEDLVAFVYEKLAERESFYINAHIIFYPMRDKLEDLIRQIQNDHEK